MTKRVTIMIDDEVDKTVRRKQAKRIETEEISVSFSRVINDELRRAMKLKQR